MSDALRNIPIMQDQKLIKHLEEEQKKVPWKEKIRLHLQEHLYIVEKDNHLVVKCFCGHEFGEAKSNWKYEALVYDRNPQELYPGFVGPDPEWCVFREFYCPGCGAQLDVEAVPPGVPFIFSFEPGI
ncbi:MAG: acetone carboxylase subunit gamma [Chloroflexota bacterium]